MPGLASHNSYNPLDAAAGAAGRDECGVSWPEAIFGCVAFICITGITVAFVFIVGGGETRDDSNET